jgi:hypothetical protein
MNILTRNLLALSICFSVPCFSQLDKGWMSFGGTARISIDYKYRSQVVAFSPEFYWYSGDHVGFGLDHRSQFSRTARNDSDATGLYEISTMPGMRIFMRSPEKAWRPYFFLNAGHTGWIRWNRYGDDFHRWGRNGLRAYTGFGLAWFFEDRAAFDLRFRLVDVSTDGDVSIFSPCTFGMTVFFGAKKESAPATSDTPVSPTQKGRRSFGCIGNFGWDSYYNEWAITLSPEMYWFVADNFGVGSDIGLGYASEKGEGFSPTSGSSSWHNRDFTFSVAPGARYFFLAGKKVRPYAFANGGIGFSFFHRTNNATEILSSGSDLQAYAGAGMAWFISEHAALDVRLRGIDVQGNEVFFGSTFGIGFQAFFN